MWHHPKYYEEMRKKRMEQERQQASIEKELEARVELEVDRALREVENEYDRIIREADRRYGSRYVEEENDETLCYTSECKSLAPPMRLCSSWVPDCPDTPQNVPEWVIEGSKGVIIKGSEKPQQEPVKFKF